MKKEEEDIAKEEAANPHLTHRMMHLEVHNEALAGKTLLQVRDFMGRDFVCSRILQNGHVSIPNRDTVFHLGDQLFVVCAEDDAEAIIAFIGPKIEVDCIERHIALVLYLRVEIEQTIMRVDTFQQILDTESVKIQTVDGAVIYNVKPGTKTDTKVRLKGKGVPSLRNSAVRGDHYVTLVIQTPEKLSAEAKEALRRFDELSGNSLHQNDSNPEKSEKKTKRKGFMDKVKEAFEGEE